MLRSLSMAIASLRNHQTFMDVISSNIANVNTTGYKASRVQFQELLSQTIRGSSAPRGGLGGLNPVQIGLGMALGGIDTLFTQGSMQDTGRLTDLAIQGDGFFVLDTGDNGFAYARDGNLDVGTNGNLVHLATGLNVQGWNDVDGIIDTNQPVQAINIDMGTRLAKATSAVSLTGNLNAAAVVGNTDDIANMTMPIYDSLGNSHELEVTFTKSDENTWDWEIVAPDEDEDGTPDFAIANNTGTVVFNTDGTYDEVNSTPVTPPGPYLQVADFNTGAAPAIYNADPELDTSIMIDFGSVTQLLGTSETNVSNQDGLAPGSLTSFTVGTSGEIMGVYSNGLTSRLGQIALAKFQNSGGLMKEGQSLFKTSANSGSAQIGTPGTDGRGQISSGYLEMSNVELAQQFTNMITAQRGFQANSRVITTSDAMLEELVNLVR